MVRSSHAWRAAYDGVRAGLERARLPRICLDVVDTSEQRNALASRLRTSGNAREAAGRTRFPVFLVGEDTVRELADFAVHEPRVAISERYAIGDRLLEPFPNRAPNTAIVFARLDAARVGRVLSLLSSGRSPGALPVHVHTDLGEDRDIATQFLRAAGARLVGPGERPLAVLHLRLTHRPQAQVDQAFEHALSKSTAWRVPLIADERERWKQGASIVLMPDYELLGRIAADMGREMTAGKPAPTSPRAVHGLKLWINLAAADRAGLSLPMVLLARADRIRPGTKRSRRVTR